MLEYPTALPLSAIIATKDRPDCLEKTLKALAKGSALPAEIIIVDASSSDISKEVIKHARGFENINLRYIRATQAGAACQRNQGIPLTNEPFVLFLDDDIVPDRDCLIRLQNALKADSSLGGVNSMITNQQYEQPGHLSSLIIRLLGGTATSKDAGRLLSGIRNVLPATGDDLPEVQPVEWLNTTCTLYRRNALPSPAFPPHFHGASVCEDLALSLVVARKGYRLANARLARIFHDSQGGSHKNDLAKLTEEEFTNRAYILRRILNHTSISSFLLLLLSQTFEAIASGLSSRSPQTFYLGIYGIIRGIRQANLSKLPQHYVLGN